MMKQEVAVGVFPVTEDAKIVEWGIEVNWSQEYRAADEDGGTRDFMTGGKFSPAFYENKNAAIDAADLLVLTLRHMTYTARRIGVTERES